MTRELVVSPRVTVVFTTLVPALPKVTMVLIQEIADFPQEMKYLVLWIKNLPLVKEVLLDVNVVFHSLLESFLNCLAAFVPASGDVSI